VSNTHHTSHTHTLHTVNSTRLVTGSADNTCRMWDAYTGKEIFQWETMTAVRSVSFAEGDCMLLMVTDATMGKTSTVHIFQLDVEGEGEGGPVTPTARQSTEPIKTIVLGGPREPKITIARWGILNATILTGHEDGTIRIWDFETCEELSSTKKHTASITDFQFSADKSHFITASKDTTSLIFDTTTLEVLKTYSTDRPVNAAAISPLKPHVGLPVWLGAPCPPRACARSPPLTRTLTRAHACTHAHTHTHSPHRSSWAVGRRP
jgi:translation initiation factor 3 subunit I